MGQKFSYLRLLMTTAITSIIANIHAVQQIEKIPLMTKRNRLTAKPNAAELLAKLETTVKKKIMVITYEHTISYKCIPCGPI